MEKYISVNKMVMKLTQDEALRTFFTLFFMADTDDERLKIEKDFINEIDFLPNSEKTIIKEQLRLALRNALPLTSELKVDVEAIVSENQHKKAA